jgi:energy-converting hydrogenase Eha subunit H
MVCYIYVSNVISQSQLESAFQYSVLSMHGGPFFARRGSLLLAFTGPGTVFSFPYLLQFLNLVIQKLLEVEGRIAFGPVQRRAFCPGATNLTRLCKGFDATL